MVVSGFRAEIFFLYTTTTDIIFYRGSRPCLFMDVKTRLSSAEQQSHELHRTFSHLEHRIREFIELQRALADIHRQLQSLGEGLGSLQSELSALHRVLPSIARNEELERFEKRLDSVPFERFAVSKLPSSDDDE